MSLVPVGIPPPRRLSFPDPPPTVKSRPLSGRVALVTGSTTGIGLGTARKLGEAGCDVVLNGFGDEAAVERAIKHVECCGVRVRHCFADVSKPGEVEGMVEQAVGWFGALHIVVNCAGVQHVAPVESFPLEQWDRILAVNLSGAFYVTRAALPHLRAAGWGRVINISSAHGKVASANKVAYVASKHGLLGVTKAVALELAGSGVTCNAICPGWVRTPLVESQLRARAAGSGRGVEEESRRLVEEKMPSGAYTTVEEVGEAALFLCSAAARNMQGAEVSLEGGWTAQ